jgi:hypothetical protein
MIKKEAGIKQDAINGKQMNTFCPLIKTHCHRNERCELDCVAWFEPKIVGEFISEGEESYHLTGGYCRWINNLK